MGARQGSGNRFAELFREPVDSRILRSTKEGYRFPRTEGTFRTMAKQIFLNLPVAGTSIRQQWW